MAATTAYTLTEAREQLRLWKECEKILADGTAKAYRIGTREYTAFDLGEIGKRIEYFARLVDALSGTIRTSRVVRVVPRDL